MGKPLAEIATSRKVGAPLRDLARSIARTVETGASTGNTGDAGSRSLIGRISDFRSLLPKRKVK